MEEYIYYNNLYDCYYKLLTDKQKKYFEDYYFSNLSLGEIAVNYNVSRNAVYKQIQNTIKKLIEYEEKLKLYQKKEEINKIIEIEKDNKIKNSLKQLLSIMIIIFIFFITPKVNAKNLNYNIDMNISIDKNGDALVKEKWDMYLENGTEIYKPFGNLKGYSISDFYVTDELGTKYQKNDNWNVNASFSDKKYKSGINKTTDGLELCWGISNYGKKSYTLNYKVTGFIQQYNDSQGIYFSFLPSNMNPLSNNVDVKISSDYYNFNKENSEVWAYGYKNGIIKLEDGNIIMNSRGNISNNEYMVGLVKISENVFSTNHIVENNFDENQKEYTNNSLNQVILINKSKILIPYIIFFVSFFIILMIYIRNIIPSKKGKGNIKNKSNQPNFEGSVPFPPIEEVNYIREVPCNKDITKIYWIANKFNMIEDRSSIMGAYLLKWISENRLEIDKNNQEKITLNFNNIGKFDNKIEEQLKNIFLSAASRDCILDSFEFKEWCKEHYTMVLSWLNNMEFDGEQKIKKEGYIEETKKIEEGNCQKITINRKKILPTINNEAIKLLGLKRFLIEFSDIDNKELIETSIWKEYIIVAEILGIADKVSNQLKLLYPNYKFINNLNVIEINNISNDFCKNGYESTFAAYSNNRSIGSRMGNSNVSNGNGNGFNDGGSVGTSSGGFTSGGGVR